MVRWWAKIRGSEFIASSEHDQKDVEGIKHGSEGLKLKSLHRNMFHFKKSLIKKRIR